MKLIPTLLAALFLLGPVALSAQDCPSCGEEVKLSTDELKSLARKMAELRARRVAQYQQQMALWQQYNYYQQQQAGAAAGAQQGPGTVRREMNVRIDTRGGVETDTIITIDENFNEDTTIIVRNIAPPPPPTVADDGRLDAEMEALRQRLDRQEELLLQIRDANLMAKSAPAKRDTVIERILTNDDPDRLTRTDLRRLSDEMGEMNREIARLRNQVQVEENRRRRAEDRMEDVLRDNRNAIRSNNRNDRDTRIAVQPNVQPDRRVREPVVIRDTVFVDRTAPARVDTVVQTVAAEPEIRTIRDTVVQTQDRIVTEEVVRTETVQLAAKEPISFPTVFFDNNSATLNTNHRNIIATMIEDMENKGSYNVRLTGYASRSGNADYNQQLSARRAEAVKQGLVNMGISPNRIRLVAGGIDFQATTPAAGRRVEIQAIPQ
ncbi:OmpA family protein [Lewinella sp. 4G2]|uniref:OmpA family protein n=1 Tax=Lewinella sp. 4G2 TaxID=1803372 RepID=UPI0007B4B502|nr:OmpA family protein [Lewinella sp. 4G2]OAV42880.1 hypothetical protein A3850_016780 [Lewinella sp. 4G2]